MADDFQIEEIDGKTTWVVKDTQSIRLVEAIVLSQRRIIAMLKESLRKRG